MDQKTDSNIAQSKSMSNIISLSAEKPSMNLYHGYTSPTSKNVPVVFPGGDKWYDVVLLYCENDFDKADIIVNEINEIKLEDGTMPRTELYEFACVTAIEQFGRLQDIFARCSYIFILCSKEFNDNCTTKYMADECVMNSIMNKDKKQPWQVVPIIDSNEKDNILPMGLNSLQSIKWGKKYASRQISKLIINGSKRSFVRSQSTSPLLPKSDIWDTSRDVSSVSSGYESQHLEGEYENSSSPSINLSLQNNQLSTVDRMATLSLQESQPIAESQEGMASSSLQSTQSTSADMSSLSSGYVSQKDYDSL